MLHSGHSSPTSRLVAYVVLPAAVLIGAWMFGQSGDSVDSSFVVQLVVLLVVLVVAVWVLLPKRKSQREDATNADSAAPTPADEPAAQDPPSESDA